MINFIYHPGGEDQRRNGPNYPAEFCFVFSFILYFYFLFFYLIQPSIELKYFNGLQNQFEGVDIDVV